MNTFQALRFCCFPGAVYFPRCLHAASCLQPEAPPAGAWDTTCVVLTGDVAVHSLLRAPNTSGGSIAPGALMPTGIVPARRVESPFRAARRCAARSGVQMRTAPRKPCGGYGELCWRPAATGRWFPVPACVPEAPRRPPI